jgi:hypothetical protein
MFGPMSAGLRRTTRFERNGPNDAQTRSYPRKRELVMIAFPRRHAPDAEPVTETFVAFNSSKPEECIELLHG